MKEMYQKGVIHRDIKNGNILMKISDERGFVTDRTFAKIVRQVQTILDDPKLEENGDVILKLADFGLAAMLSRNQAMKYYCGTPFNMAPEVLNDKYYCHKADMWSFGVAIYEALCGQRPFKGENDSDLKFNVMVGIINIPPHVQLSKLCLDFLSKCLS